MHHNQPSGKILYLILWGGAAIIGTVMVIIGYSQQADEKNLLKSSAFATNKLSGDAINDLLLSGDELTIAEKKSFISLYLKPSENNGDIAYQKGNNKSDEVYRLILQRKMNRSANKSTNDFSVKPIPK
jgi:ethanolamine ammonia-lyase large subunit